MQSKLSSRHSYSSLVIAYSVICCHGKFCASDSNSFDWDIEVLEGICSDDIQFIHSFNTENTFTDPVYATVLAAGQTAAIQMVRGTT